MKTYVLDTTVLMDRPELIFSISKKNKVIIPPIVIRQLDNLKNDNNKKKRIKARAASRTILSAQKESKNVNIATGIKPKYVDVLDNYADNKILGTCLALKERGEDVSLLTSDVNMRIVAKNEGVLGEFKGELSTFFVVLSLIWLLYGGFILYVLLGPWGMVTIIPFFLLFKHIWKYDIETNSYRGDENRIEEEDDDDSAVYDDSLVTSKISNPRHGSLLGFRDEEGWDVCNYTTTPRNSFVARFWEKHD